MIANSGYPKAPVPRIFWLLLIAATLMVVAIFNTSCVSEKKRAEICRTCPQKDSVSVIRKDSIVYRDSIVFFTLAGDTVKIASPCDSSGKLKAFVQIKKKNGLVTTLKSDGKTLEASCAADSLMAVIEKVRADHYAYINSSHSSTIKLPCENERTSFDGFCRWVTYFVLICVAILLACFALRFVKR